MKRFARRFGGVVSGLLLVVLAIQGLGAQTATGQISGTMIDPDGAVVIGGEVVVTNTETGSKFQTVTTDSGRFILTLLPPGTYQLRASVTGFQTYQRNRINVRTGDSITMNVVLTIGELSSVVSVDESAPLLEESTSDISQLIEPQLVNNMPLDGRRALQLAQLVGTTVWVADDLFKPNFSLAGGRTQSQNFSIDGGTGQNMRLGIGQIDTNPPMEVTREFKVLSNSYSAEYGGSAGGLIIMTTKAGTNHFHGSLFEYLRNDRLNAANFFAPFNSNTGEKEKAPLRYNIFGGTVGGPVIKDRTHFFAGYEATRIREGATQILTVPTEQQRRGDFSQTFNGAGNLIPIYDPATTRDVGGRLVRDPFPGNVIPPNRLDRVARALLSSWPLPNRPASNLAGANNFTANSTSITTRDNLTTRVDHTFKDSAKIFGRYMFNDEPQTFTSVYPNPAADPRFEIDSRQHNLLIDYTQTFTPTFLNDFRFAFLTRKGHLKSVGLGQDWETKLGLRGISDAFPRINVTGVSSLGSTNQERAQFPIRQYQIANTVTWIRGSHFVKVGAEVRKGSNFEISRALASGQFSFAPQPTGAPGVGTSGLGFASFLLGFPSSVSLQDQEPIDRYSWYLSGFVQDDWKIHPNLTLNLGLRWETDTPMADSLNRMNGFDPEALNPISGTRGVVRFAGVNGWPNNIAEGDWNNFGPRIGFAWSPFQSKKTVIRGGFGVFFAHPFDHGAPASAALGYQRTASFETPDNGITAPFFLENGLPAFELSGRTLDDSFGAVPVGRSTTTAVSFFERNRRTGYSEQVSLSVQRELRGFLLEGAYLGNLSRKLSNPNISLNQIPPDRLTASPNQRDRPFPQFTNVSILLPAFGVANYHAGTFKVERRYSQGLSLLMSYTLAKNIGDTDSGGAQIGDSQYYQNFYNRRADRGINELDITHRFIASSVWELPFGKGKRWLTNHPARHLVGGWTFGSISQFQSGPAFTVRMQASSVPFLAGPQRPDLLRNPNLPPSERSINRWFDTGAFVAPGSAFGNAGTGVVRGDGRILFDFSLIKAFQFSESKYFQLRMETFNSFNHPNFALPAATLNGPGFGTVTGARAARIIQIGMRMVF